MSKHQEITTVPLDEVLAERFAVYGTETVKDRAVPSIEDGLNPVTRKILWTYLEDGYTLKFSKAASHVGKCLG